MKWKRINTEKKGKVFFFLFEINVNEFCLFTILFRVLMILIINFFRNIIKG